ncbi:MAG: hypothetical protein Fur0041_01010 [Bacteroidia bacterium]
MKKVFALLPVLLAVISFTSCSLMNDVRIEKKHYGKGYYVDFRGHNKEKDPASETSAPVVANETKEVPAAAEDHTDPAAPAPAAVVVNTSESKEADRNNSSEQKRSEVFKKAFRESFSELMAPVAVAVKNERTKADGGSDTDQLILVILALLIPPLAVYLFEGLTKRFWVDLICFIIGVGFWGFFGYSGYGRFFYWGWLALFSVIYAVLIVLEVI